MTSLWHEPLAKELARGLAGTRVVPLIAIEPNLDPAVHHASNLPFAIISDRHTLALVAGQHVMIDGPQRTNNDNRCADTANHLEATRKALHRAAEWGVHAPAEQGGLVDTALSIMRFLAQSGSWGVYLQGTRTGMSSYIAARRASGPGTFHRWPASLGLATAEAGIQIECGDSKRVIRSLTELGDFAAREAKILDAQVLWCTQHVAMLDKLRPFGEALRAAIAIPRRTWSLHVAAGGFSLDAKATITIYTDDTQGPTATLEPLGDQVKVTIGAFSTTVATPSDLRALPITAAVEAWLASPDGQPPARDMDYYR